MPTIKSSVVYLNMDKTKGLTFINGIFSIVKQNSVFEMRRDGTIYNNKILVHKEGLEMLNMMVRGEKLKKIKKKIDVTTK
jgi:hypothetical protein